MAKATKNSDNSSSPAATKSGRGTTAKASLIKDGRVPISMEYEVGAGMNAGHSLAKGGGYPIRIPSVNISEVGAGGGSIAWIDSGGALRVGPHSAGAEPGPVCYVAGGTEPTVTDANVVLGYMNPSVLAGGRLRIDRDLARRAIEDKIAGPLGMDVMECAFGIHTIANANMIRAVRSVTTERGRDPRTHVLVSFGGAGPLHAVGMAALLEIPEIIVPVSPGLFSAIGLQFADTTCDFARTFLRRLDTVKQPDLEGCLSELEREARSFLDERRFEGTRAAITFHADLRYLRQSHELSIPLTRSATSDRSAALNLGEQFASEHERTYGYRGDSRAIEIVNLRSRAIGSKSKLSHAQLWEALDVDNDGAAPQVTRDAYFGSALGSVACIVLRGRRSLGSKPRRGPVIVEEFDTTIVVPPEATVRLDAIGNVVIDRAGNGARAPAHQVFPDALAAQVAP